MAFSFKGKEEMTKLSTQYKYPFDKSKDIFQAIEQLATAVHTGTRENEELEMISTYFTRTGVFKSLEKEVGGMKLIAALDKVSSAIDRFVKSTPSLTVKSSS